MADIARAIFSKLTNDFDVSQAIGSRIYPSYDRQTERKYPLVVYTLDIASLSAFDGLTGVETATLDIAAIARDYETATYIAKKIRAALDFQAGDWTGDGEGAVVQGCFLQDDGERDDHVTDPTSEAILFYVKHFRFDLTFNS